MNPSCRTTSSRWFPRSARLGTYLRNNVFGLEICVTVVLKVLAKVEVLVPSYGYCEVPPCEEFADSVCDEFFCLPLFPQAVCDEDALRARNVSCTCGNYTSSTGLGCASATAGMGCVGACVRLQPLKANCFLKTEERRFKAGRRLPCRLTACTPFRRCQRWDIGRPRMGRMRSARTRTDGEDAACAAGKIGLAILALALAGWSADACAAPLLIRVAAQRAAQVQAARTGSAANADLPPIPTRPMRPRKRRLISRRKNGARATKTTT